MKSALVEPIFMKSMIEKGVQEGNMGVVMVAYEMDEEMLEDMLGKEEFQNIMNESWLSERSQLKSDDMLQAGANRPVNTVSSEVNTGS